MVNKIFRSNFFTSMVSADGTVDVIVNQANGKTSVTITVAELTIK